MTDYHDNETTYTYTARNQLSTLTAPGSKVWTFHYNALGQPTYYDVPNGMTTNYAYDTLNHAAGVTFGSLPAIEHKDGSTVLDGFYYELSDSGSITQTTHEDGSYWDYYYDNRYRLTKAERFNSGATIKAKYEYTYSLADNMLTKVEPFFDDFNDGAYTGWSVWSGTWSAANNMAENTSSAAATLMRSNTDANYEASFRFRNNDTSNNNYFGYFWTRYVDGSNRSLVYIMPNKVQLSEQYQGTWTTLDSDTGYTTTQNTWYNFRIVCDGSTIEVYRWEDGQMPTKVLESTSAQVTTSNYVGFAANASTQCDYDDIRIISDSLSNTTTMTYDAAGLISTATDPNGTITFGFDAWGRVTSTNQGSFGADFTYNYDGMLVNADSDFPNEGTRTFAYGSDRRIRSETTNDSVTYHRYTNEGLVINSEDSSHVLFRTFVRSGLRSNSFALSSISGSDPSLGHISNYFYDITNQNGVTRDSAKALEDEEEDEPSNPYMYTSDFICGPWNICWPGNYVDESTAKFWDYTSEKCIWKVKGYQFQQRHCQKRLFKWIPPDDPDPVRDHTGRIINMEPYDSQDILQFKSNFSGYLKRETDPVLRFDGICVRVFCEWGEDSILVSHLCQVITGCG